MEYERAGAATRRRERRLRSWWRHERMTVAMELAVATHHSSPKGGWPGATHDALRGQTKASSGGRRPGVLKEPEPPNVVERVLRHTVDQFVVAVPLVPVLDVPVPQMAGTVLDFCRTLDLPVDEQVITVPKFSPERVPQRLVERCFPQLAEQLVEVPTVLSYSLLQQRYAAQQKKEEEELEAARRQLLSLLAVPPPLRTAEQLSRIQDCNGVIRRIRRMKKRKKKKLPRAPRPRCGRPCARQRQVPAVQVVHVLEVAPASVPRQSVGHSCFACRDVYPQYELCRRLARFYRCCSRTVPPPDLGGVGYGSSPNLDTKHTIYELSLPSERGCPDSAAPMCCGGVCVEMSCGGFFSWWCLRICMGQCEADFWKLRGLLFPVPRGCGCVCMLNFWFSRYDTICADNYIYFRFNLQACVAVRSGSCICMATRPSRWTVILR